MRGESFWTAVHEPFMSRDLTRDDLRQLVRRGLTHTPTKGIHMAEQQASFNIEKLYVKDLSLELPNARPRHAGTRCGSAR